MAEYNFTLPILQSVTLTKKQNPWEYYLIRVRSVTNICVSFYDFPTRSLDFYKSASRPFWATEHLAQRDENRVQIILIVIIFLRAFVLDGPGLQRKRKLAHKKLP